VLQGKKLSDELIKQAGAAVPSDLHPLSDHRASAAYRSAMAKTMTGRALQRAVARLN
jgi:CO/xanthine dehydrogenase FAD-binding subunit